MDTDVLIVGAGPTGLMLANQLGRRGISTIIIDRHAGPALQTRALGVQARTLEIYSQLGIVERALSLGKRGTGANLWAQGRKTAHVPLGEAGKALSPYPFILILGQDDNEKIMGERLEDWDLAVQWETELVGLAQESGEVVAKVSVAGGAAQKLSAAWVAGCDGAGSAVRELNGITFAGAPYEHVFFVADVEATGSMVPDEVNVYLWRSGFHLFFPMRGKDHWRVVGIVPAPLRDRMDLDFDAIVPSVRKEAGASLAFKSCTWFSTYRIHHRAALRFRARRCFLLGDAAHIHSPVGAQGMNTGLQDAYNLAWKLALVIQGRADEALLDTYEEERIPVAQRLLKTTDRGFRLVVSSNWWARLLRTQVLARLAAFAMRREKIQGLAFRTISQIGIHYRERSMSQTLGTFPHEAPRAGDRFPWLKLKFEARDPVEDSFRKLEDTHFHLLVFGPTRRPPGTLPLGDLLRSHWIPEEPGNDAELARARIPRPSFYLLRPDGHVGCCGSQLDLAELVRYVNESLKAGR